MMGRKVDLLTHCDITLEDGNPYSSEWDCVPEDEKQLIYDLDFQNGICKGRLPEQWVTNRAKDDSHCGHLL